MFSRKEVTWAEAEDKFMELIYVIRDRFDKLETEVASLKKQVAIIKEEPKVVNNYYTNNKPAWEYPISYPITCNNTLGV